MAEESDLERTEPASPRRLEQAREDGDVPRSRELATCAVLLASGLGMWFLGANFIRHLNHLLAADLAFERALAFDSNLLLSRIAAQLGELLLAFTPLALLLVGAAIASP